jgi:hypothetical protein
MIGHQAFMFAVQPDHKVVRKRGVLATLALQYLGGVVADRVPWCRRQSIAKRRCIRSAGTR